MTLSNGLETIGDFAFYNNSLTNIVIESQKTQINCNAFDRVRNSTSIKIAGIDTLLSEICPVKK